MPLQFLKAPALRRVATLVACGLAAASALDATAAATKAASAAAPRPAHAAPAKAPPFVVATPRYEDAPEPYRSYLIKARAADAIADKKQRCLAFPPFPGSKWPANLLPAHCEWAFGLDDAGFTLAELRKSLDAKDTAGLEQRYRKLQDRHFSDADFSEHIHQALDIFDSSYESGALSKRWLEAAPDSPFAMTARADFYRNMGWAARGAALAKETPDEQFERLHEFHAKAAELYLQALEKEPRLMHAYAGLLDMAKNGGSKLDAEAIYARAMKIDPACKWFLDDRMQALKPRWGGSYEEMLALEQQMLPHLAQRPLLALSRIWPYDDMRDVLYADKKYDESAKVLKPMIEVSSSPQVFEDMASSLGASDEANRWEELAYLVELTRFRPGNAWHQRERGRLQMLLARDAEMANRTLAEAVKAEPASSVGHYLYAASFSRLGKIDEAEREYLVAMQDKPDTNTHRDALFEVAELVSRAQRKEKAQAYAKQAITEYPTNGRSWVLQAHALAIGGTRDLVPVREALENILKYADPTDPRMNVEITHARRDLDTLRAAIGKSGGAR